MRRILIFAIAWVALPFSMAGQKSASPTNLVVSIEKIRPSTVQIRVQYSFKNQQTGYEVWATSAIGTGFFANAKGDILTCRHVVDAFRSFEAELTKGYGEAIVRPGSIKITLLVGLPGRDIVNFEGKNSITGGFWDVAATVARVSQTTDVAVLHIDPKIMMSEPRTLAKLEDDPHFGAQPKLSQTLMPRPAEFDRTEKNEGEAVAISGFPLRVPSLVTTSGAIATKYFLDDGQIYQLADMTINKGNSGGPVYRVSDGKVIGIGRAFLNASVFSVKDGSQTDMVTSSGITEIVPIVEALKLLDGY